MLRRVAKSPFWTATSKFLMVVRTISSCDALASESRVSSRVPSIATAASAAITRISATTQPQLRLRPGGLAASSRPGIISGATGLADASGPLGVEMISVAGSGLVSMNLVADESIADGAVYLRSAGCSSVAGSESTAPVSSTGITSVGCSSTIGAASVGALSSDGGLSADSSAVSFPWSGPDGCDIPAAVLPYHQRSVGSADGLCTSLVAPRHNRAHDADG